MKTSICLPLWALVLDWSRGACCPQLLVRFFSSFNYQSLSAARSTLLVGSERFLHAFRPNGMIGRRLFPISNWHVFFFVVVWAR